MNFREGLGGESLQSEKFVAKKRNIVFRNEGGGVGGEAGVNKKTKWPERAPKM